MYDKSALYLAYLFSIRNAVVFACMSWCSTVQFACPLFKVSRISINSTRRVSFLRMLRDVRHNSCWCCRCYCGDWRPVSELPADLLKTLFWIHCGVDFIIECAFYVSLSRSGCFDEHLHHHHHHHQLLKYCQYTRDSTMIQSVSKTYQAHTSTNGSLIVTPNIQR